MAYSQLILELFFLHIRDGSSLTVAFKYVKRMLPLFRTVVKFCSTNRLFTYFQ